jgi:hypothetical protein
MTSICRVPSFCKERLELQLPVMLAKQVAKQVAQQVAVPLQ